MTNMAVKDLCVFLDGMELTQQQHFIGDQILKEIRARVGFLKEVGLEYLTLTRATGTLSGGEAQRIRLATQIGSDWWVLPIFLTSRVSVCIRETMISFCGR